jgi:TetR/AcrR family transcriptional regulator, mexCD-oprJ operon repressor
MSHPEIAKLPDETSVSKLESRPGLQQRVSSAILEAAARVLAERGSLASMSDVAEATGVARATVYRYFPNRQALLDELARRAVTDAGARIAAARLDALPVPEGVARAVRSLVDIGDYFVVLARERVEPDPQEFESHLAAPLRQLLERGQADGTIRPDVPATWLTESLVALVVSVLLAPPMLGSEDTIAAITGLFLSGAAVRPEG